MISCNFDINEFISKTMDTSFDDFILISNQEATEAERYCLKTLGKKDDNIENARRYANSLKALIRNVRYEVCTGRGVEGVSQADIKRLKAKNYTIFI
jgi:hypothetical protein